MRQLALAALALCLGWTPLAAATDLDRPLILVAKPDLHHPLFASTVLVVAPIGGVERVYLGGPVQTQVLFALVQRADNPGGNSFEMMPGLYAAFDGAVVDRIIESDPAHARFVAGLVAWSAGELRDEIKQGAWYVLEADAALLTRNSEGLWEELVRRSVRIGNAI